MEEPYDIIIVGGGPAGLTAGLYASRHKAKTLVLEGARVGGKAYEAHLIENYPGFPEGISGPELVERMEEQALKFGASIKRETVIGLSDLGEVKMVSTRSGNLYQAKALIIATGITRRQLNVEGEAEFKGRGVSYCAVCDGPFFQGKRVAVVGAGEDAVHDVEVLSEVASKVYGLPGRDEYNADPREVQRLEENDKVELVKGVKLSKIGGRDFVEYVELEGGKRIDVEGVFIVEERVPMAGILSDLGLEFEDGGCVKTNKNLETGIPGVFAAGDCACQGFQVVIAAGMGARAALNALKYLKSVGK